MSEQKEKCRQYSGEADGLELKCWGLTYQYGSPVIKRLRLSTWSHCSGTGCAPLCGVTRHRVLCQLMLASLGITYAITIKWGIVSGLQLSPSAKTVITHKIDVSKSEPKDGWSTTWTGLDVSYQRNNSHLMVVQAADDHLEEIFWSPPLPNDKPPPYIVELSSMPSIISSGK
uniref:Dipeptidylpeptidase IV N-terminal domain-containing protein n=1 Tax=Trichuris muris TaxID=70415 RepID=A0A5S6R662_TRIMR